MGAKCPGQDQRYWNPQDIFDVRCPYCGREIEFWKDEPFRICRSCQREVRNPRIDLACAEWCASADECLGHAVDRDAVAAPVVELLMAQLEHRFVDHPDRLDRARQVCAQVDTLLQSETADPRVAKPAALLAGAALSGEPAGNRHRAPAADPRALEPVIIDEVLSLAGIEGALRTLIAKAVRSVFTGGEEKTAESIVVSDAVRLVLARTSTAP